MNRHLAFLASLTVAIGFVALACSSAGPAPAPTQAPAAKPAAAQPTAAPAAPAAPAAAAKAPEPTKPAAQPTAAPKVNYPEKGKTITIISPWAAGGSADIGVRLIASALEQDLGASIQVVNKEGAGGQVGMTDLVHSKPDGYTLATANIPATMTTYLDPKRQAVYGRKDLQMVALYDDDPSIMATQSTSQFKTMKDVFDYAKANPEQVKASSSGPLTSQHIQVLNWQKVSGVKFAIVQFTGSGPGMTALLGGHIDLFAGTIGGAMSPYKSGQVRVLGVASKEKSPLMPDVPTMESQGYPVYGASDRGVLVPAGTPMEIVNILAASIKKSTDNPDFKAKMAAAGLTMRYMGPADFSAHWDSMEANVKASMVDLGMLK